MENTEHPCSNCSPACLGHEIREGFSSKHALFMQSLGICSAIALTGYIHTTLVIGIIILLVAVLSALLISLIRKIILRGTRFLIQVTVITSLVIGIHLLLQAYWSGMRDALGPYLGLVITNCLIMDSCEQIGLHHNTLDTVKKAFGRTIGYVLLLLAVALIREPLGNGSIAGFSMGSGETKPVFLVAAAPGAFFILGIIWWIMKALSQRNNSLTMDHG